MVIPSYTWARAMRIPSFCSGLLRWHRTIGKKRLIVLNQLGHLFAGGLRERQLIELAHKL
jgi:hypothetical protein